MYGINFLRTKLDSKRSRVRTRYEYYDMKHLAQDFGISTPPNLTSWMNCLGWCSKAVDSLADRLVFREFADDSFDVNDIFAVNNPDVLFSSAILGALISSCDFVYISTDADEFPRLQVIDGGRATGVIDPITGMLSEGYAVLEVDELGQPVLEAYFTTNSTQIWYQRKTLVEEYANPTPWPLLVPIIHRPDAVRPFGRSIISRSCMSIVDSAMRTMKRSEIAAEFYSVPQKWVLGTSPDADRMDKWNAAMSAMLEITKDEQGDRPVVGQFQQQSMSPHVDQLKMFASMFAGETGLTLDDLGFTTGNPSSSDAIRAAHEDLRLKAKAAQRSIGSGFLNVGYLAACLRDKREYTRSQFYMEKPKWEPVFEPDSASLSGIGDAAIKLQQSFPDYFNDEKLRDLMGI